MKPKVSIIMPIFRHPKESLIASIRSILNQTFEDFELIITDGSADDSNLDTISSIKDNRIRYFKIKGYINCLNTGIKAAKGIYIARMDSDDISLPARIEEQVKFLDNNQEIDLCSCLVENFGERNDISSYNNELTLLSFIKEQYFVHPAMMFRKELNIEFENIKPAEDCLLFYKLLLNGHKFAIIDKVLFKRNISKKSIMATYPKYCKFIMSKIKIWALAKYYNFNLSFTDKIIYSKSFSEKEVIEYLAFINFLKKELKEIKLNLREICLPLFSYMISKCNGKSFLIVSPLFYKTIFIFYLKLFLKIITEFIFSIKNKYTKNNKTKVICILGIKIYISNKYFKFQQNSLSK